MDFDFGKPLFLRNNDGEAVAMIDEIEHRIDEVPILRGHFVDILYDEYRPKPPRPTNRIKNVIFNNPATIVIWSDGSKTVVKCQPGDTYDKKLGLAMCICKKHFGNKGNYNEVFKKFISEKKEG